MYLINLKPEFKAKFKLLIKKFYSYNKNNSWNMFNFKIKLLSKNKNIHHSNSYDIMTKIIKKKSYAIGYLIWTCIPQNILL